MNAGTHFSSFDFFKTVRQTIEEVLPLLVEAEPQIELQLSLNCPACRTKPLLTRQLWTQITAAGDRIIMKISILSRKCMRSSLHYTDRVATWPNP